MANAAQIGEVAYTMNHYITNNGTKLPTRGVLYLPRIAHYLAICGAIGANPIQ